MAPIGASTNGLMAGLAAGHADAGLDDLAD
jgi:hypothetical protein